MRKTLLVNTVPHVQFIYEAQPCKHELPLEIGILGCPIPRLRAP